MKNVSLMIVVLSFSLNLSARVRDNDFYKRLAKTLPYPEVLTENSTAQLMDSLSAMFSHYQVKRTKQDVPLVVWDKTFYLSDKYPLTFKTKFGDAPSSGPWVAHGAILRASKEIGLSDANAQELGFRIQHSILTDLGADWNAWCALYKISSTDESMKSASSELNKKIRFSAGYEIPYLAGYSVSKPWMLYIDNGIKDPVTLEDGRKIFTIPFLLVHEAFEKALIEELQLEVKSYLRTHQIAQRLELESVIAHGYTWDDYQVKIMGPEIERAGDVRRVLKRVPANLDLTPYVDYKDWALIRRMKRAMVPVKKVI